MNVLSLFDGISTGQLVLKQLDINVDNYYASEIEESAISITQYNFPNTIQLGDVNNWEKWDIDWSKIDKKNYLNAMKKSPLNPKPIYKLIKSSLTDKTNDRELFMKGIDYSYYYEEID